MMDADERADKSPEELYEGQLNFLAGQTKAHKWSRDELVNHIETTAHKSMKQQLLSSVDDIMLRSRQ